MKSDQNRRKALNSVGLGLNLPLPEVWQPLKFEARLRMDPEVLESVRSELSTRAAADPNECCGYFPALAGRSGIITDLPACRVFATAYSKVETGNATLRFCFLRLSLRRQTSGPAYHLDTDAATAVTGDPATLSTRLVWRALLNVSRTHERTLRYLDLDPFTTTLSFASSYVCLADRREVRGRERHIAIPPCDDTVIHGVRFPANRVLHSGGDDDSGHFVAAYGLEVENEEPADRAERL